MLVQFDIYIQTDACNSDIAESLFILFKQFE